MGRILALTAQQPNLMTAQHPNLMKVTLRKVEVARVEALTAQVLCYQVAKHFLLKALRSKGKMLAKLIKLYIRILSCLKYQVAGSFFFVSHP